MYVIFEDGGITPCSTVTEANAEAQYYNQIPSIIVTQDTFNTIINNGVEHTWKGDK